MPDAEDEDHEVVIVDLVQDPVVPNSHSIAILGPGQFSYARGARIIRQPLDRVGDLI